MASEAAATVRVMRLWEFSGSLRSWRVARHLLLPVAVGTVVLVVAPA
jgi:hypothetical protein